MTDFDLESAYVGTSETGGPTLPPPRTARGRARGRANKLKDRIITPEGEPVITDEPLTDTPFAEPKPEEPKFAEDEKGFKPDRRAARHSGEGLLGMAIVSVGSIMVNRRWDVPVGRMIQLEAPLAAQQIDKVIAHTWIDKLLQPFFSKSEEMEALGVIIGLPLMVGMVERKPELLPVFEPIMYEAMTMCLQDVAELRRKEKIKTRRTTRSMADVNQIFDLPAGEKDPVGYIFNNFIFAVPPEQPQPESADNSGTSTGG